MKHKPDIIIVDDDPHMTALIAEMIEDYDLIVECYNDSVAGLDMIVQHKPRIVFLDFNMPNLKGDKFMVKLSEKYIFQTTSIFLVTAEHIDETYKKQLLTLGFDHIIHKPFSSHDIYNAIASVIGTVPLKIKAA